MKEINYMELTNSEHFALNFIANNNGKSIPKPLPPTVRSLIRMGLVKTGNTTTIGQKCFLTVEAARFHKLNHGEY